MCQTQIAQEEQNKGAAAAMKQRKAFCCLRLKVLVLVEAMHFEEAWQVPTSALQRSACQRH